MAGYGTDAEFSAWLSDMGYTLPANAPLPAALRQRGSNYIDAVYGNRFVGNMASFDQDRAWPRTGAFIDCRPIPDGVVPKAVIIASYYAAYQEAVKPGSLTATGSAAGAVVRKKVGELEVQYAAGQTDGSSAASITPLISTVDGMLSPYLRKISANSIAIKSIG